MAADVEIRETPIEDLLVLPRPLLKALWAAGLENLGQLLAKSEVQIAKIKGIGGAYLDQLRSCLRELGFRLGSQDQERGSCTFCEQRHSPWLPFGCHVCQQCGACCECDEDEDDEEDDEGLDMEFTDQFDDEDVDPDPPPQKIVISAVPPTKATPAPKRDHSPSELLELYVNGLKDPEAYRKLEGDLGRYARLLGGRSVFERLRKFCAAGSADFEGAPNELLRYLARFSMMALIAIHKARRDLQSKRSSKQAWPDDLFE